MGTPKKVEKVCLKQAENCGNEIDVELGSSGCDAMISMPVLPNARSEP
jgi:hypothetical protein